METNRSLGFLKAVRSVDERPLFRMEEVCTCYGDAIALKSVSISVNANEVVAILGSNGAGKTTSLRTLAGFLKPRSGRIIFRGERIEGLDPHRIIKKGIASVVEGRDLFCDMNVLDNLLLGAYSLGRKDREQISSSRLNIIYDLFPVLKARRKQRADTLSGGEQQMLAVGRALMANPRLITLDEPSLGLSPLLVIQMMAMLKKASLDLEMAILVAEQNARAALKIADNVYVFERGEIVLQGPAKEVATDPNVELAYLGR